MPSAEQLRASAILAFRDELARLEAAGVLALDAERPMPPRLTPGECRALARDGAIVLDTRSGDAFAAGHPAGALHMGLDGQYASWVGTIVDPSERLVLMTDAGREEEAVMRLARVGYENVLGVVEGDMAR